MNCRQFWLACAALAAPIPAQATDWTGANSTNWFDAGNWSAGVPTAADVANIATVTPNPTVISAAPAVAQNTFIGLVGGPGQLTVTGAGASLTNTFSTIAGDSGVGTLNITNGGQVFGQSGLVGSQAGSTGTATVSGVGSGWTNSTFLLVGSSGTGTLRVENGGQVTSTDFLVVGNTGTGSLFVESGAQLANGNFGAIGNAAGGTGQVRVSGAGSSWANSGFLLVGADGSGTLLIENGGQVSNTNFASIGHGVGSTGHVTVSGAGSGWTTNSFLFVGNAGTGTLLIQNGAQLTNTGFALIGAAAGSTGQATVSGAGAAWTSNDFLNIGSDGTGTLTIQNGGTVTAPQVNIAAVAGSTGTLNIGAAAGAAAVAPGTLNAPAVTFGGGTGQIVFNHTGTNHAFAPAIGGPGTVRVESGTTNLTANNTYTGNTTVNGGTLLVNGSIATSPLTIVNAGGTLGGAGIVGNTSMNGGTLSPGNSIGTLTVQGSLAFTAASTYLIEVDPATSDRTNVTGTAQLGGARVAVNVLNGASTQRYTILNAAGGITGTFGAATANNFIATLSYDPNNVFLNLQAALGLGTPLNQNQQAVATAINNAFNLGGALPSGFASLFNLSGINLANALTQLSGEAATGTQQTTFDAMDRFLNVMTDPFLGTRGGGAPRTGAAGYADDDATLAYASTRKGRSAAEREAYAKMAVKAPPRVAPFERRWSVWGTGYGGIRSTDGNALVGSNDYSARIYGGAAGFDYRLTPDTLVGFALGGAGTKYDLANGLGGGRSEMFQAGIYGRHHFGPAYIASALAYGWQDVTTDRVALLNSYRAEFDANAISGRLEAGYRYAFGMSGITPYAAGQFTTLFLPGYAEQTVAGSNVFALVHSSKDVTASRSELGLRADTSFAMQDAIVTLRGRAAWAHNFNTDRSVSAIFQTLPVAGFVVNGASPARDTALVSAGAEARWLNGFSVAATFEGEFSGVTESYAGKGIVRYQW
jgi:T5SS/PEP-CTERM-associated repeat protein/autotransporter-associated beta strand protein